MLTTGTSMAAAALCRAVLKGRLMPGPGAPGIGGLPRQQQDGPLGAGLFGRTGGDEGDRWQRPPQP
jgi:hypothetical protein